MADSIVSFSGDHFFLSNFYQRTLQWTHPEYGTTWAASVEHHFQAAKASIASDWAYVLLGRKPSEAKRRGRTIKKRADWDEIRIDIMRSILEAKFAEGRIERTLLLRTGDAELVEGNTWGDTFWGQVYTGPQGWLGENHLGKLLMEIRDGIRSLHG
jgi:ribA/ribD-fused uncharacterized protein